MSAAALRLARALSRTSEGLRRASTALQDALGAALQAALTPEEKAALGLRLYADALASDADPGEAFDWERTWWAADLPPPPARILLGGAGVGREARVLRSAGYDLFAYDPLPAAAERLAALLGRENAARARHEDLPGRGDFDAVLLGWGSFTHVLDPDARRAVLAHCARLTDGPILASVWTREAFPPSGSRAARLGARLGALRPGASTMATAEAFAPWCGFGHLFDAGELAALGESVGRRTDFRPAPYPHVTWVARRTTSA